MNFPNSFSVWSFRCTAVQSCYIHVVNYHVNILVEQPPFCVTGGGEDPEEGQEEDPQQAVCSGEPQEEEGVC